MKTGISRAAFGILLACLAVSTVQAQLNDASNRTRVVNGFTIDITPAIEWNRTHHGAASAQAVSADRQRAGAQRPLPNWVLVEGKITNELSWAWVVVGRADGLPATFVLKHPPLGEYNEFKTLQQGTAEKRASLKARAKKASDREGDSTREIFRPATKEQVAQGQTGFNAEALRASGQLRVERMLINDEIQKISKGYDLDKDFPVRVFAMKMRETFNGLQVLDRGVVPPHSPNTPVQSVRGPRRTTP